MQAIFKSIDPIRTPLAAAMEEQRSGLGVPRKHRPIGVKLKPPLEPGVGWDLRGRIVMGAVDLSQPAAQLLLG